MQNQYVLAVVLIASFSNPCLSSCINVAIPVMAGEFHVEAASLGWVVTAYLLGAVCMMLPFGRLADTLGRKRLFQAGIAVVAILSVACAMAPEEEVLILLRFLQGISIASVYTTNMALLVSAHEPSQRGRVIGFSAAATYIGLSLGPFLGGVVTHWFGWRMLFFGSAAFMGLCLFLSRRIEGEWYGDRGGKLDLVGSLLYMAGSLVLLYGLSVCGNKSFAPQLIGAGIFFWALFLWEQRRSSAPLLELSLFRNTFFAMSSLASFLHYSATYAIGFLMSLYLQVVRGMDEVTAGCVMLLQPVMMALLSPLAGAVSDRLPHRIVASAGMGITASGLLALSFLKPDTPMPLVGGILMLIGIGFAFFSSPNSNAIMSSVEARQYGVASSVLSIMRMFGESMSMVLVTALLHSHLQGALGAEHISLLGSGIPRIFFLFALVSFAGAGISMLRGKRRAA